MCSTKTKDFCGIKCPYVYKSSCENPKTDARRSRASLCVRFDGKFFKNVRRILKAHISYFGYSLAINNKHFFFAKETFSRNLTLKQKKTCTFLNHRCCFITIPTKLTTYHFSFLFSCFLKGK